MNLAAIVTMLSPATRKYTFRRTELTNTGETPGLSKRRGRKKGNHEDVRYLSKGMPRQGIEPWTLSLLVTRSTTEPTRRVLIG